MRIFFLDLSSGVGGQLFIVSVRQQLYIHGCDYQNLRHQYRCIFSQNIIKFVVCSMAFVKNNLKKGNPERLVFPVGGDSHLFTGVGKKHFQIPDDSLNDLDASIKHIFNYQSPQNLHQNHTQFDTTQTYQMFPNPPHRPRKNRYLKYSSIEDLDRSRHWYQNNDSLSILQNNSTDKYKQKLETFGMPSKQVNKPRERRNKESPFRDVNNLNIFENSEKIYELLNHNRKVTNNYMDKGYIKLKSNQGSPWAISPFKNSSIL